MHEAKVLIKLVQVCILPNRQNLHNSLELEAGPMRASDEEDDADDSELENESSITSHLVFTVFLLPSTLSPDHDSYNSELGSDSVELLSLLCTCVTTGARRGGREFPDPSTAIGHAKACKAIRMALMTEVVIAFPGKQM